MALQERAGVDTFFRLTCSSTYWTLLEYGTIQTLRFGANLVLTRLLLPDTFGIMQLVLVFTIALELFSDLGINVNVVQHPEGESLSFLQTAWTLQLIRGIFLWGASLLLAWPFANLYQIPELTYLLPVGSLGILFANAVSPNLYVYQRRMRLRVVSEIRIVSYLISTVVMLSLGWMSQSVWALLAASVLNQCVICFLSHRLHGASMKLRWDPQFVLAILTFGKWVIGASSLAFLVSYLDKLFLGLCLDRGGLGCYMIAFAISSSVVQVLTSLSSRVLLPLYRHYLFLEPEEMRKKMAKVRALILAFSLPFSYLLMVWGEELAAFLYPNTYAAVGWMLQVLALGTAGASITASIGPVLLAAGDSYRAMLQMAGRVAVQVGLMSLGMVWFGLWGVIVGIACVDFAAYPLLAYFIRRHGVWLPALDGFAVVLSLFVAWVYL